MKHLKSYNESIFDTFKSKNDIRSICRKYNIKNYSINDDGSIDVDGDVDMSDIDFDGNYRFPLNFRNISGRFIFHRNRLESLEGCPESIGGDFDCSYNDLTSLKGCPKSVGSNFDCSINYLKSLEGCPKSVGNNFACQINNITTFEHLPFSIGGVFYCGGNPIYKVWKLFEDYSKIEFLNDCDALREPDDDSEEPIIILDRLNFFLEEIGKPIVNEVKGYNCI